MVETRFPRWADSPPQFLIWEIDELIPVVVCFVLILPTRNLMLGLIIGIILMRIYKNLKNNLPSFFYLHYLWFWGIWVPRTKSILLPRGYISYYRE